ncbi:putative bestrophin domain protein [Bordetella hinzii CA90 BAL1384]|uniref:Bestrophin domain protein n=2 Tax=Bordetella hinzii TaxID=103855 RepID=A0ABR4R430_9BORD|nr:putative bestrophin domain protein [Bordetella hinzii OH87 BAL007II]KCB29847.1 putative bestrophin domain protein [Bordetella hinzii CA90 BAL1384]KCB40148.1 putative bestrophin domain protein [Bordetella hinzii 5132]
MGPLSFPVRRIMIVRPRPSALALLFILRGSILPRIAGKLLFMIVVACAVAAVHAAGDFTPGHLSAVPFSLFGLALSVFLGFRNNVCYDRWWEARKQWGELIVQLRALSRETRAVWGAPAQDAEVQRQVRRLIAFPHALAARLREQDERAAAAPWLDARDAQALEGRVNPPDVLLGLLNQTYREAAQAGRFGEVVYQGLVQRLGACGAVQAACERIRFTPTPFAYSLLLHRTAWIFCLLLPFGLVGTLGALMPLAVAIIAYTFFGLDALGDELEDPFGLDDNDLPLNAMARQVAIDLLEGLGQTDLPPPLRPRRYQLD